VNRHRLVANSFQPALGGDHSGVGRHQHQPGLVVDIPSGTKPLDVVGLKHDQVGGAGVGGIFRGQLDHPGYRWDCAHLGGQLPGVANLTAAHPVRDRDHGRRPGVDRAQPVV
jgi:hypothetical protein